MGCFANTRCDRATAQVYVAQIDTQLKKFLFLKKKKA